MTTRAYTHSSNQSYALQQNIKEYKDYYTREKKQKSLNSFYVEKLEIQFSGIFYEFYEKLKYNFNLRMYEYTQLHK